MKTTFVLIMSGLLVAGLVGAAEHPEHPKAKASAAKTVAESIGLLDGKVFVGEMGKKGNKQGDKDEFVFKNGTFVSTACVAYGFNAAPYVAKEKGEKIMFTASPTNDKAEKMNWKCIVIKDQIKGTAVHEQETGTTEYWFKGTLKAAAATPGEPLEHPKKAEHPKKSEHPEHPK